MIMSKVGWNAVRALPRPAWRRFDEAPDGLDGGLTGGGRTGLAVDLAEPPEHRVRQRHRLCDLEDQDEQFNRVPRRIDVAVSLPAADFVDLGLQDPSLSLGARRPI